MSRRILSTFKQPRKQIFTVCKNRFSSSANEKLKNDKALDMLNNGITGVVCFAGICTSIAGIAIITDIVIAAKERQKE